MTYLAKQPKRFLRQSLAGAELLLRGNWGGVLRLAARLREIGMLFGPAGLSLARTAVYDGPQEPLDTDLDTFARLIRALEGVPEMEERMRTGLDDLGLLPKPRSPKSSAPAASSPRCPRYSRGSRRGQAARSVA